MFIILNIGTSSEAGKLLEQKRQEFIAKIRTFYSKKTEDEVLAIFSMYWGLSFAPELNDQAIKIVLKQFKKVTWGVRKVFFNGFRFYGINV